MSLVDRSVRIAILTSCLVALATLAQAQRAIPDDNLAYPVLVQRQDGAASGFYLNTATSVYLVTAKHVLFEPPTGRLRSPQISLLSYARDPKDSGKNIIAADLAVLSQAGEVTVHTREDVVVVRIATVGADPPAGSSSGRTITPLPGVILREATASGILGVALDSVKKYDEVLVANEVILFGYPTSLGLKEIPQLDPLRPLLRTGIVAGQNPTTKSLVIDCPAYPGNSGGAVVEVAREAFRAKFRVIGVVREFVPFEERWLNLPHGYVNRSLTNSGYAIVTPMDFVLELVK